MKSPFSRFVRPALGLLLSIAVAPAAEAGRVSLVPTTPTSDLMAGETVSFDVMMDFTTDDSGLGSDATLGGGFDIDFDPTALRFDGLADAGLGDPGFGRDPDILSGLLESWGFASFNGLTGPALVGSVSFIVLEGAPEMSSVSTKATSGPAGPFVSALDFQTLIAVQYNSVVVTVPEAEAGRAALVAVAGFRWAR